MEHPGIITLHLDNVPLEVGQKIQRLSDLCYRFGPWEEGFTTTSQEEVARNMFGIELDRKWFTSSWQYEEALVRCILDQVALNQSHKIYVVQLNAAFPQGHLCLISVKHDAAIQQLMDELHLLRTH